MGFAISNRLFIKGWKICAYNRTIRAKFKKMPFEVSSELKILQSSEIIIISLFDEMSVRDLLLNDSRGLDFISPGSTVIDTTTHNPSFANFFGDCLLRRKINYLDAPVSGGPDNAKIGELTLMVGGDKSTYFKQIRLFESISNKFYYLGESGSGQAIKLVNQVLVGISQIATAEAIAVGMRFNVNKENLVEVIKHSAGDSAIFRRSAPQILNSRYSKGFQTHLIAKDLDEVCSTLQGDDLNLPLTQIARDLFSEHKKSDFFSLDGASIYEHLLKNYLNHN